MIIFVFGMSECVSEQFPVKQTLLMCVHELISELFFCVFYEWNFLYYFSLLQIF